MPCCCATNVKAAFVLGIVLAVLSLIGCVAVVMHQMELFVCLVPNLLCPQALLKWNGIIGVIIHCVLIFGAHTRNSTAILVWMVLAILSCIGLVIMAVLGIIGIAHLGAAGEVVGVVLIVLMIGIILFQIWTIIVAKNARKEIEAGEYEFEIRIRNSSMHAFK